MSSNKCSRREAIKTGANLAAGVALSGGVAGVLTACGTAAKPTPDGVTDTGVAVPNNPQNLYAFDFATYDELQSVGGSLVATVAATSGTKTVSIARTGFNSAETVSVLCSAQPCQLNAFDSGNESYTCPCCGSIFSASGGVLQGPANQPLQDFSTAVLGTSVQVTIA